MSAARAHKELERWPFLGGYHVVGLLVYVWYTNSKSKLK